MKSFKLDVKNTKKRVKTIDALIKSIFMLTLTMKKEKTRIL